MSKYSNLDCLLFVLLYFDQAENGGLSLASQIPNFSFSCAGYHVFAVYGDNFFKSASYTIEALCAASFAEEKQMLKAMEAKILTKRADLSKFESEYREIATYNKQSLMLLSISLCIIYIPTCFVDSKHAIGRCWHNLQR